MPRGPAKPKLVAAVWQISRVAKKAIYLGQVEAPDATSKNPSIRTAWRRAGS